MDERLEKALDFSNYMLTLNNQKRILKEKFDEECVYYHKGGKFTVTKELVSFINVLVEKGNESVVLVDDNEIPVSIDDTSDFLDNILDTYFIASNNYHNEFDKLKKNRSVEKLINYNE